MPEAYQNPRVIWRLLDGKPGHESQTLGLAQAMVRHGLAQGEPAPQVHDIRLTGVRLGLVDWLFRRFRPGAGLPAPDWILGAGHRTHWPLLCARRACGGRTVALMTPSLPLRWFDHVIAPRHDGTHGANVLQTLGVLNAMQPSPDQQPDRTLVLLGGLGKHYHWDNAEVLRQVEGILARWPQACITDSRRTPESLRQTLKARWPDNYQPWHTCPPGWLARELPLAGQAWVSEDSVSMIYEALTAGCRVGLITLRPVEPISRVVRGVLALVDTGQASRHNTTAELLACVPVFDESARAASYLLTRFTSWQR